MEIIDLWFTAASPYSPVPRTPTLATIHDRMPVILSDRDADDWMNPLEKAPLALKRLLRPAPEALLLVQAVSPLVNSVKNEGPELLASRGIKQQLSFNF